MPRRSPSPEPSRRPRDPEPPRYRSSRPRDDYDYDRDRDYSRDRRDKGKDVDRRPGGYGDRSRDSEGGSRRGGERGDRDRRDAWDRDREGRERERGADRRDDRDAPRREPDSRRRDDDRRDHDARRDRGPRRSASPPARGGPPRASRSPSASPSPAPAEDKAKPNFGASGLLAAATNTVKTADGKSTVLKYNEPPEARAPVVGWRLYVFKGSEQVDLMHIHRQSAYLIGRDRMVCDIPLEHPSCSKQHAVIQFRYIQVKDEFGGNPKGEVKPFVIDLESTNGTHVNDEKIPTTRFYELRATDVLKFGTSQREYVLLHDDAT
ncbi:SMAD/FHA domain-containing protein [Auriscalpium vulgare]|uniref:SMAD/FHA domain-containing protein n=1 Tax=Auriscalpium vulgare TaxID=40419 RepID=A0ACB8RDH1_9AGAM|nr:SMAD/FHA domain-containing protein [Auriscalpium vulgare]